MLIKCPESINTAFSILENSGYEAYIVGGCVRDAIMNKEPNDWDMTTSALPEQIIKAFDGYKTIPTGLKHGTVTIVIESDNIEITTMRIDGKYLDNRRPDYVEFTSKIEEDLSRRDFTVNAIAYNPSTGLTDPFGGMEDIEKKIIRCVGNPDKRFGEDSLRILRAIRFASTLNFDIDAQTAESIMKNASLLHNVSSERIRVELVKLLQGENAEKVLTDFSKIFFTVIPELESLNNFQQRTPYHIYDIWIHTVKVVASVKNTKELRIAALLHDIGKPQKFTVDQDGIGHFKGHQEISAEIAYRILRSLKFSNSEIENICSVIAIHDLRPNGTKKQIVKWCSKYGTDTVANAIELMKADAAGQNPIYYNERLETYALAQLNLKSVIESEQCLKISNLDINGNDLIAIGANGKKIGDILNCLLEGVIDEKIPNNNAELINYAKKLL